MANSKEDPRLQLENLQSAQVYRLLDTETCAAYIGQTTASLGRRRTVHLAHAREDPEQSALARHLDTVIQEKREKDITIEPLDGFESERDAIEATGLDSLLNEEKGTRSRKPTAYDSWDEGALEVVKNHRRAEAARILQEQGYDASPSVVSDARRQLGIRSQFSEAEAEEVYLLYRATSLTYEDIAGLCGCSIATVGHIITGHHFADLDRDTLDERAEGIRRGSDNLQQLAEMDCVREKPSSAIAKMMAQ